MSQPVLSLRLSKTSIEKLRDNGYHYHEDIEKNLNIPWIKEIHNEILENHTTIRSLSALDLCQAEFASKSIVTMSQSLDKALGNGVPLKHVIELCGIPGNGRTQLCLQLCVSVQIPRAAGGLDGEAVYIDTSSNFKTSRLLDGQLPIPIFEIAEGCRKQMFEASFTQDTWASKILQGVHYVETFGTSQFCASIILLEELLKRRENVKLIIVDNIAFPFKSDCTDTDRTGILCRTITTLRRLAVEKDIAVVLTNEMNTRIGIGVVGALGDAWAHCSGIRLYMSTPHIAITHNSNKPDTVAKIQITRDGIRDCG